MFELPFKEDLNLLPFQKIFFLRQQKCKLSPSSAFVFSIQHVKDFTAIQSKELKLSPREFKSQSHIYRQLLYEWSFWMEFEAIHLKGSCVYLEVITTYNPVFRVIILFAFERSLWKSCRWWMSWNSIFPNIHANSLVKCPSHWTFDNYGQKWNISIDDTSKYTWARLLRHSNCQLLLSPSTVHYLLWKQFVDEFSFVWLKVEIRLKSERTIKIEVEYQIFYEFYEIEWKMLQPFLSKRFSRRTLCAPEKEKCLFCRQLE